jgi:hypothetical protein
VERFRQSLQAIERRLTIRPGEGPRGDDLLALPEFAYLKNKSRDELLALQRAQQAELKRYEEGLRIYHDRACRAWRASRLIGRRA